MTVPRLADYCFIHIPDGDGRLRRVAERYQEPNPLERFVAQLKLPPPSPIMRVLRTGASVWLPWRVFVMPGSTIGDGSVIGANSLVSGNIPPKSLATRPILYRSEREIRVRR